MYDKVCFACHAQSWPARRRLGDKAAWAPRLQQGTDALVQSVIKGKGAMPPKAGNPALTDAEVARGGRVHGLAEQVAWTVLFIIDPPEELKAYKDTTRRDDARRAGARARASSPASRQALHWAGKVGVGARHAPLAHRQRRGLVPRRTRRETRPLLEFDAVLMRKDPPFDMEYVTAPGCSSEAERQGARVFNAPRAIRDHNEKFAIAEFSEFTVPSLVTRGAMADLQAFIDEHRNVVLKRLDGMGGAGIFRVRHDDPNRNVDRRDHLRLRHAQRHGAALHPRDRARATSACC